MFVLKSTHSQNCLRSDLPDLNNADRNTASM